ncbi:MAG: hypothetical protein LUG14_14580, partial [Synergistaceae bacterium]|nr:hypothetical protein [Synergistaceae bacterium]
RLTSTPVMFFVAGGIWGDIHGRTSITAVSGGVVSASGGSDNFAGGIAGWSNGTITNNVNSGGKISASGGSDTNYAGGIAGYSGSGTIANCANNGGTVTASGGSDNCTGGIAGYNTKNGVNISNSCWHVGDLKAVGGGENGTDAVSADVVSLGAAEMQRVVTTVLPVKRSLFVALGGSAPALISYPGRADDMTGYLSVSGDISVASPDIAGISDRWPCAVSGKKNRRDGGELRHRPAGHRFQQYQKRPQTGSRELCYRPAPLHCRRRRRSPSR